MAPVEEVAPVFAVVGEALVDLVGSRGGRTFVAHPGGSPANVALGPWIHTGSDVQNFGLLHDGSRLSARGRVAELSERKGHDLVDLDVLLVADGVRPVMHVRHSAIYRLRPPSH